MSSNENEIGLVFPEQNGFHENQFCVKERFYFKIELESMSPTASKLVSFYGTFSSTFELNLGSVGNIGISVSWRGAFQ